MQRMRERREYEHMNMNDNGDSKKQEKWKQSMSPDQEYKGALPAFSVWNCYQNLRLFKKAKNIM